MIFALVVSPLLMQRYDQFDDPFYLYYNDHLFVEEYVGIGVKESEKTASNYIEEQGVIGNTNMLENKTSVELNNSNSLTFETRQNREIDLTEDYNLIYEYQNDCLIAGIEFKKDYYSDGSLKPEELLFFSVTIMPFGKINSPGINQ